MDLPSTLEAMIGKRLGSRTRMKLPGEPNSSSSSLLTWRVYRLHFRSTVIPPLTPFSYSVMPCGSRGDAERIRKYVTDYQMHPNQMKFNGRIVVSTFAGESCRFGASDLNQGWLETLRSEGMPPVLPLAPLNSFVTLMDHL
jgi:hypothetical protein